MLRLTLVVVSLLLAAPAMAQTVVADFTIPPELLHDFPEQIGEAPLQGVTAEPLEADGNPVTEEWLLHFTGYMDWYRIVAVRPTTQHGYCAGLWFRANPYAADATIRLTTINQRAVFIVNYGFQINWPLGSNQYETIRGVSVIALDVPQCD